MHWFERLIKEGEREMERDRLIERLARCVWFRARVRIASVATEEELDRWAEDGGRP